jgi:hypothetical protein
MNLNRRLSSILRGARFALLGSATLAILTITNGVPASAQTLEFKFKISTVDHRARLEPMAQAVLKEYGIMFSHLNEDLVRQYIALHDLPKVQSLADLQRYGYTANKSIMERLAPYFGRSREQLAPEEQILFDDAVRDLNAIEEVQKKIFFRTLKLDRVTIRQLRQLEYWIDNFDTRTNRRVELAIKGPDAIGYFLARNDQFGVSIGRFLVRIYTQILEREIPHDCLTAIQ